jgi:hypothetical protein
MKGIRNSKVQNMKNLTKYIPNEILVLPEKKVDVPKEAAIVPLLNSVITAPADHID